MSQGGANSMLMWLAGVLVGVGAAQGRGGMLFVGGILTLAALYYFRRFCDRPQR